MLDSLSNYSKYIATVVGILFVVFCAVTAIVTPTSAVAVDTADMIRDERVGTQHTVSVALTDLYEEPPLESWTLTGSTALVDVTWTIIQYDQTGAQIDQQSYDGQRLTGTRIAAVDGTNRVIVRVAGTIPRIESFSYDPKQSFRVVSLTQTRTGGSSSVINIWTATHSTEQSASAREELTTARETVSTVDSDRAKQAMQNAIDAYNGGEFALATRLASEAEEAAKQAQQSNQMFQYVLYALSGIVVIGGASGIVYWRRQQRTEDKL